MTEKMILIFLGGGAGSLLRFGFSKFFQPSSAAFPWATLGANLLAGFMAGMIAAWLSRNSEEWPKYLLLIGFCGGLSTFSTFSLESFNMVDDGKIIMAIVYSLASIILCFAGTAAGWMLAR